MTNKILLIAIVTLTSICIAIAQGYSISAVDYPREIVAERGWTNYFDVIVENTGGNDLSNVTLNLGGDFQNWFSVLSNQTTTLSPGMNATFMVKLSVPSNATVDAYTFTLYSRSKEVMGTNTLTLRVFKTKAESMLYQVQEIETEISGVQINATNAEMSGRNVTSVLDSLNQASEELNISKGYIASQRYDEATAVMMSVEDLITRASFDLTVSPPVVEATGQSFPYQVLFVVPAVAVAVLILFVLRRRAPAKSSGKVMNAIVENKKPTSEEEIMREVENSKKLLENEFKENLISKESYDELVEKYDKTISELKERSEKGAK